MPSYHPVSQKIISLLEQHGYWYETFEHEPVRTSEEAAKLRDGYTQHQGAKALILRIKKAGGIRFFCMLVLPGDAQFDSKKVLAHYQAKDLRFATPQEVSGLTDGVLPGGVPPFGNLFGLEVLVDPTLLANEKIIFNAGDRAFSVATLSKDYLELVQPQVVGLL